MEDVTGNGHHHENGNGHGATRLQELAMEGQKHLESTVEAAHQILSSMNDELCNPALWVTQSSATTAEVAEHDMSSNGGGGALEESRLRYKATVTSLRAVISTIASSLQVCTFCVFLNAYKFKLLKNQSHDDVEMDVDVRHDQDEIHRLELWAEELREEVKKKNQHLKVLIDQLRDLIDDISMWQSPIL